MSPLSPYHIAPCWPLSPSPGVTPCFSPSQVLHHHIPSASQEDCEASPSCPSPVWPARGHYIWEEQMALLSPAAGMQRKEEQRCLGGCIYQALRLLACMCTEVLRVQPSTARTAGGARWGVFRGQGLDIRQPPWSRLPAAWPMSSRVRKGQGRVTPGDSPASRLTSWSISGSYL